MYGVKLTAGGVGRSDNVSTTPYTSTRGSVYQTPGRLQTAFLSRNECNLALLLVKEELRANPATVWYTAARTVLPMAEVPGRQYRRR